MILLIKTITPLEYYGIESLTENIKKKLRLIEPELDYKSVAVRCSVDPVQKKEYRRKIVKGVGRTENEQSGKGIIFRIPRDTVVFVEVPEQRELVFKFIKGLSSGKIRLGENTTLGCGICKCCGIEGNEQTVINSDADISELIDYYESRCDYVTVKAHSDGGILIRDNLGQKGHFLVNEEGIPIIPASTWKGIFRNCIQEWITYKNGDNEIVGKLFGDRDKGIKGQLIFYDSVFTDYIEFTENRLHLNKFSGEPFIGGLKEQNYVSGSFEIKIECLANMEPYKMLIATVLRDLHCKRLNVGADIGIGKGFVEIDGVHWKIS